MSEFNGRIKHKVDTLENWNATNPVLLDGEIGIARDTSGAVTLKVGNGTDSWSDLPKVSGDNSTTPQIVNIEETVLWEGDLSVVDEVVNLSDTLENYDYIGIAWSYATADYFRGMPMSWFEVDQIKKENYSSTAMFPSTNFVSLTYSVFRQMIFTFPSATEFKISEINTQSNDNSTKSVTKIVGIKFQEASSTPTYEIDEEPTEGSTNLVTSGGVKEYVDNVLGEIELLLSEV